MGLEENGKGDTLGFKNKYKRMDSEVNDDEFDDPNQHHQLNRSQSTKKYVFACAVFASLNSVLLGYGNFLVSAPLFPSVLICVKMIMF